MCSCCKKQQLALSVQAGCSNMFQQYVANGGWYVFCAFKVGFYISAPFQVLCKVSMRRFQKQKETNIGIFHLRAPLTPWTLQLMTSNRPTGIAQTPSQCELNLSCRLQGLNHNACTVQLFLSPVSLLSDPIQSLLVSICLIGLRYVIIQLDSPVTKVKTGNGHQHRTI